MLEPEYRRDMQRSYLVLKEEKEGTDYSMKMLANNKIKGFLELEIHAVDNKKEYCYETTGKQTMDILFRKTPLRANQIKTILTEMIMTIKRSREYLLLEDNFVLEPEYIYMNLDGAGVSLIYFSGHEERIGEQLLRLIEYMMDRVDYKDKTAVYLIYGIYKLCREESCTFERILEYLTNEESLKEDLSEYERKEEEIRQQEKLLEDMEEEVESEEEKRRYPLWVWAGGVLSVFISLGIIVLAANKGIFFDLVTGQIMIGKMAILLGVLGAVEAFVLLRLLDEKNKIAYIDRKTEYIKPVEEKWAQASSAKKAEEEVEKQTAQGDDTEQATVVLAQRERGYILEPEQKEIYMPIMVLEFPFFIGTLKTKVDYAINSRNVSRFHAKLEQEGEKFYLADLNSTNGTFINGRRLLPNEREQVELGDLISFADVTYRFSRK